MRKIKAKSSRCSPSVSEFIDYFNEGNYDNINDAIYDFTSSPAFGGGGDAFDYLENDNYQEDFEEAFRNGYTSVEDVAIFYLAEEIRNNVEFVN